MAFPWLFAGLAGLAYVLMNKTPGSASPAPAGGGGAPPGGFGSAGPDASGLTRIQSSLLPFFMQQLAQRSALPVPGGWTSLPGSDVNVRMLGPAGAGENAAAWIAARMAQGLSILCTTDKDPGMLLAVPPGQEGQYAAGQGWAILALPGDVLPGLGGALGGLGGALGGLGGALGGAQDAPATLAYSAADFQVVNGFTELRGVSVPGVLSQLAAMGAAPSASPLGGALLPGEEERTLTGSPLTAPNAAAWAQMQVAQGRLVLVHMDRTRLRAVLPGREFLAAQNSDWGILLRPLPPGQLPANLGGSPSGNGPFVPPPPPAGVDQFPDLPAIQRSALLATIGSNDPARMRQMANEIQATAPISAATLRKAAADVEGARRMQAIAEGRMFTIRMGDIPSRVALWFFGDANKWRDLARYNGMKVLKTGLSQKDWAVGRTIELMPGAMVEKGAPPVAVAGPASPPPPAPAPPPAPPAPAPPGGSDFPEPSAALNAATGVLRPPSATA